MSFDGLYRYSYDAWNRLARVDRTYGDPNDPNVTVPTVVEFSWGMGRAANLLLAQLG
jgi:hypothetical protein